MAASNDKVAAPAAQAPQSAPKAPEAPLPSKTKQLVGGIEGVEAQARALEPQDDPKKPAKPAEASDKKDKKEPAAPTPVAADDKGGAAPASAKEPGPEELSPLREALLKQFQIMEGKGIGDAEFEAICGKDWWEKRKQNEAAAKKYNTDQLPKDLADWQAKVAADPEYAKTHPKPVRKDDSVFTTCIATQGKLLEAAFKATNLHVKGADVKYDLFAYATMGRIEGKKRDAWVESKPGIGQRPKRGDVLVLEMRGAPDKVQKDIDGENSQYGMFGQSEKKLLKQIEQAKAASAAAGEAQAAASSKKLGDLQTKLAELRAKHDEKLAKLQLKLDEARKEMQAKAGTEKAVKGGGRMGGLEFSHVGLFNGMSPEKDPEGKETGRELWTTFDGGAHVPGKVDAQGAKSSLRVYDPKTNEIAAATKGPNGQITQDMKTRWLGGWVDIDALVDPDKKK